MIRSPTLDLLQRYRSDDPDEAGHRTRMLALVGLASDPFSRHTYEPGHFTASAFVLSPDHSHVLLIFHGKLHRWLQPGGHVEPTDATLSAAARREVEEEVGLAGLPFSFGPAPLDLDIHRIPPLNNQPEHDHFDVRFCFTAPSLDYAAGSEVKDARWFPLSEVDAAASDASVLRAIQRIQTLTAPHRR